MEESNRLLIVIWSFVSFCMTAVSILFYTKMHKGLLKLWYAFLLSPLTFVVVQFSVVGLCVNEAVRTFVSVVLWLRHRGKAYLANHGADAVWEYKGKGNTRMVLVPLVLKQGELLDVSSIANVMEKQIFQNNSPNNTYKKLKCILTTFCGYVCWKEMENFDVRDHVRRLYGNEVYTDEDVSELFSGLCQDMDYSKPQWEILIIPRFMSRQDTAEKSIVILRFHHGMLDGMSLLMMLDKLSPDFKFQLNPLNSGFPFWKIGLYYLNALLFGSLQGLHMILNSFRKHWIQTSETFGKKRFAWCRNEIEIETLHKIRFQSMVSIPNILGFSFAESCRRILPPKRLLENIYVGEILAMLPYPNSKPQNRFMSYSYSVNISPEHAAEFSLKERLAASKAEANEAILGPQPLLIFHLFKIVGRLPTIFFPLFMSGTQDSCYLSHVPCSRETFSVFNTKCEAIGAFPACFSETGITIGSTSYGKFLSVCGACDSSWLSEDELTQILHQIPFIIDELADSTSNPQSLRIIEEVPNGNAATKNKKIKSNSSNSERSDLKAKSEKNLKKATTDDENQNFLKKRGQNRAKKIETKVR